MDKKIKKALIRLLHEETVIASWGINNILIYKDFIEFDVSGFLYQGKVKVLPLISGYRINLDNGDFFDCSLVDLVKTLDSKIEKSDNYEADLRDWLVHD